MNILVLRDSAPFENKFEISILKSLNAEISYLVYSDIYRKASLIENIDLVLLETVPDQNRIIELAEQIRSYGFKKTIFLLERQEDLLLKKDRVEYENELMHLIDGGLPEYSNASNFTKQIEKGFFFSCYIDILQSLENSLNSYIDNPFMLSSTLLLRDRIRYIEAVSRMATLEKANFGETLEHAVRVGVISKLIAQSMGLDPVFCNRIELAAPLHDIGMTALPEKILMNRGKLRHTELDEIKTHSIKGWLMLNYCETPVLEMASEICLTHHERWDGRGYPEGLSGNNIPTTGIITSIADSFDVMMSSRPYKKEILFDEAINEVSRNSRTQFSPVCSYAMKSILEVLRLIYWSKEKIYNIAWIDSLQAVSQEMD